MTKTVGMFSLRRICNTW